MDSFFGIGAAELLVILLLAGLIMGPQRIRDVARWLGRVTAQMQGISREFARQLNAELDAVEGGDVRDALQDVQELRRQVQELRQELAAAPRALVQDGQKALKDGEVAAGRVIEDLKIAPPNLRGAAITPPKAANDVAADERTASNVADGATPSGLPTLIEVADDPE